VGRFGENDVVLKPRHVSRRHCVVLVHATGGCEVFDTASRNGTYVNRRRVGRSPLLPGDLLHVSGLKFLVTWVGPDGRELPAAPAARASVETGPLSADESSVGSACGTAG
jgi:pSer/pThr/pTyr-binding forkhead associated (FHA) protein